MPAPKASADLIRQLIHDNLTDKAIHELTGASRSTVARHRRALGLRNTYFTRPDDPACRHGHPFPKHLGRNKLGHLVCTACLQQRRAARPAARATATPACRRARAADRLVELDEELWQTPARELAAQVGCSPRTVHRVRAWLREEGRGQVWAEPEPDEVAVEWTAAGERPERLTVAERHAAIRLCRRQGLPVRLIAERLGCSRETVYAVLRQTV